MRPLVTLDRVDVRLAGAEVLSALTFTLHAGEGIAVLGPNGSGKSTLLRLLRGELWPDPRSPGRRLFHGPDGAHESPIGVRERLARVSPETQDAYVRHDWDLPVEAVIRSGFFDALWPAEAATPAQAARIWEVARMLGVEALLGRSILEVSRGEGRRILLARALAPAPDALLLDEACDGLDAGARAAFLDRVSAILRGGTAVVMATHRPEEIVPEIRRAVRLDAGRLLPVEAGAVDGAAAGARTGASEGPTPERPSEAGHPGSIAGPWGHGKAALRFRLECCTVLVQGRTVLDGIHLAVRAGERWTISGPNGAGKSTLLRLLAGEEQPARGEALRLGLPRAAAEELRGRIGVVSPDLQARHRFEALAEDVILSGFAGTIGLAAAPTEGERARARAAAERLGIALLLPRHVRALSYGELRKVLLARALAPAPEALLLDEPLAGLDAPSRAFTRRIVEEAARAGTAVVAVSHHADELPAPADGVARLEGGRLALVRSPRSG